VFIDSDTYSSAKSCFKFVESIVQEGTFFILDDYFSYKGSDKKGVAAHLRNFYKKNLRQDW